MQIIPIESSSKQFHKPELFLFSAIFSIDQMHHIAKENFLYDDRDCYIKGKKEIWKYGGNKSFFLHNISIEKRLELYKNLQEPKKVDLYPAGNQLWIPIYRVLGDTWEKIGTGIHTQTEPPQLFTVMVRGNIWLLDTKKQQVNIYKKIHG